MVDEHHERGADGESGRPPSAGALRAIQRELAALRERVETLERAVEASVDASVAAAVDLKRSRATPGEDVASWASPAVVASPPPPPPPPLPLVEVFAPPPAPGLDAGGLEPSPQDAPPRQSRSLELLVGGRLAAWVGALVVVLGAAFFFQYAHAHGWLGAITPLWRCLLAAGFGALLLVAGELALRRVNRAAAVGLFAAGLGTLYLTVLVAYRHFGLVGDLGAFVLFVVTALVGLALTVRSRALVVGVLSLLAGYAAPLMTDGGSAPALTLPLYLTMLLGILLGLSGVMPRPFRVLRHVGLPVHGLIGFLWMADPGTPAALGTIFVVAWWGMVFAEALLAALRGQSRRANAAIVLLAAGWLATVLAVGLDGMLVEAGWAGAILTLVAIASVALVTTYDLRDPATEGRLSTLRTMPRRAMSLFSLATWLQAGVLLATAAALQFAEVGVTVAWLALGLAAIELGRRVRAGAPALFGSVVLLVAAAKISTLDLLSPGLRTVLLEAPEIGLAVTPWSLLALGGSLALGIAACRVPQARPAGDELVARLPAGLFAQAGVTLCAVATVLGLAAFEGMAGGPLVAALWLVVACVLLVTRRACPHLRPLELGGAALIAAIVRWLASDAWSAGDAIAARPWLNAHLLLAIPMAAAALWFDRILSRQRSTSEGPADGAARRRWAILRDIAPALPVLSVLAAVSIEVLRAVEEPGGYGSTQTVRWLWWVIIWALGGALLTRLGRLRGHLPTVRLGLSVAALSLLAWLTLGSLVDRTLEGVAAVPPILNLQALSGVVAVASALCGVRMAISSAPRFRLAAQVLAMLSILGLLCVGSYEVERLVPAVDRIDEAVPFAASAVSLWWGLFGTGLVIVGFLRRLPLVRYAGLTLLGVTVGKFLLLDLRAADNIWRVVALVAVGLLLLAIGVLYVQFGAKVVEQGRDERRG